jgi:hypothetical protein
MCICGVFGEAPVLFQPWKNHLLRRRIAPQKKWLACGTKHRRFGFRSLDRCAAQSMIGDVAAGQLCIEAVLGRTSRCAGHQD